MSVSVILTCHNEERFIVQAVESVINQTASGGIREIIIVNDGSTDGSAEVIASLVDREPRIHVLTTAGVGASSARNLAIRHATGDFIAFLDGDDFWAEDKLERQLTAFGNGCKAALVYGDLVDFSAPDLSDAVPVAVGRYRADQRDTLPTYFLLDGPIVPSSIVMRRKIVEDIRLVGISGGLVVRDTVPTAKRCLAVTKNVHREAQARSEILRICAADL